MSLTFQDDTFPTHWSDDSNNTAVSRCIPPLTPDAHKGSSGRIGVFGGSARYTGAPYYAAMASLKVGADLALVFCAEEAAIPIKCYSPELMVAAVYSATKLDDLVQRGQEDSNEAHQRVHDLVQQVQEMFDRLHVLIVGPGMGRCPLVMRAAARLVAAAQERHLAVILDADALFMIAQPPFRHLITTGVVVSTSNNNDDDKEEEEEESQPPPPLFLTPNAMEYKRLVDALLQSETSLATIPQRERFLQQLRRGVIVICKGQFDVITAARGKHSVMTCQEEGGLKRSGGLGDVLAGTLGTFVAWNRLLLPASSSSSDTMETKMWACWTACCIVKRATRTAFQQKKRAMTAPDVLNVLGDTVDEMTRL